MSTRSSTPHSPHRIVGYMSPSAMLQQQQRDRIFNQRTPRTSPFSKQGPPLSLEGVSRMSPLTATPKSRRSTGSSTYSQGATPRGSARATPRSRRSHNNVNLGSARLSPMPIRTPQGMVHQRSSGASPASNYRVFESGSPPMKNTQAPPSPVRKASPSSSMLEVDVLSNPGSFHGLSVHSWSSLSDADMPDKVSCHPYCAVASDSRQVKTVGTSQFAPIRAAPKTLSSVRRVRRSPTHMPADVLSLVTPRDSGNSEFRQEARRVARELHRARRSSGSLQTLALANRRPLSALEKEKNTPRSAFSAVPKQANTSEPNLRLSSLSGFNKVQNFARNDSVPSDVSSFRVVNPYC